MRCRELDKRLATEHRCAGGFDDKASNRRLPLLQRARHSAERATAPDELAERVDLTVRLVPHLRPGAVGVRVGIAGKPELIGAKRTPVVCDLPRRFLDECEVVSGHMTVSRRLRLFDEHDLGTECARSSATVPWSFPLDMTATNG